MTTVYGVTFIGAREQIEKQLKDRGDISQEDCWGAASYLAKQVLFCIGDLFSGAKAIQTWLNISARLISRSIPADRLQEATTELKTRRKGPKKKTGNLSSPRPPPLRLSKELMTSVIWTTPLGLPIVQPYRKLKRKQVMTSLQTIFISDPASHSEVNSMKQASAFPPNFIHSLDATHMMLTAIECRNQDLSFAAVHDSYWTHACSIDKMSEIIRDTFIALHSSDVLQKMLEEFHERYKGYKIPLVFMKQGSLLKQLIAAGAKIVATKEQASSLTSLGKLIEVSDNAQQSTVDEGAMEGSDLKKLVDILNESKGLSISPTADEEANDEELIAQSTVDLEEPSDSKVNTKSTGEYGIDDIELLGKFVDLTAALPPLPKKGDFQVDEIKRSQYFFS
jgi:DNA-directed RNA polymerase